MGVHFTSYSSQLGVLVLVGVIVNADQDVFDGLRHDPRLPSTRPRVPIEQASANMGGFGRNMGGFREERLAIAGRPVARFFVRRVIRAEARP